MDEFEWKSLRADSIDLCYIWEFSSLEFSMYVDAIYTWNKRYDK